MNSSTYDLSTDASGLSRGYATFATMPLTAPASGTMSDLHQQPPSYSNPSLNQPNPMSVGVEGMPPPSQGPPFDGTNPPLSLPLSQMSQQQCGVTQAQASEVPQSNSMVYSIVNSMANSMINSMISSTANSTFGK